MRRLRKDEVECPYCEGSGDVFNSSKVHGGSIDPPMDDCPVCNGSGYVDEDEVDNIDCDKSLGDYQQDAKDEADLARWESKQDR